MKPTIELKTFQSPSLSLFQLVCLQRVIHLFDHIKPVTPAYPT